MNDMAYKDTTILETLTGSRLHVLVALAMPDCPQPVTATWLAGRAGLSRQSAETALRRLAEYELVEKVGNKGGAGWLLTANVHQLPFPLRAMFAAATMTNFLPLLSSPDATTAPQSLATTGLTGEISDCISLSLSTMTKKLPLPESLCQADTATVSPLTTSLPQMTNILSLSSETMTKNLPLSERPIPSNVPQLAEPHGPENEMTKNSSLSSGTMTKNLPLSDGVPPEEDEPGEGMTKNLSLSPATMVKNLPFANGITPKMDESKAEMTKNLSLSPETMTKNLPLSDHGCLFVDLDLDLIQQQTNNHRTRTTKNLSFSAEILRWMGMDDPVPGQFEGVDPVWPLSCYWYGRVAQKGQVSFRDPVGYVRRRLERGVACPDPYPELARAWLGLSSEQQAEGLAVLRRAEHTGRVYPPAHLPDLRWDVLLKVYQALDGQLLPPNLMPSLADFSPAVLKQVEPLATVPSPERIKPPSQAHKLWHTTLGELALQMTKATYNTWLKDSELVAAEDQLFTVQVQSEMAVAWLENRLKGTIERTLTAIVESPTQVRFVVG